MKIAINEIIEQSFEKSTMVSVTDIWKELRKPPFGLLPNTGSVFLLGFLLGEYADSTYYKRDTNNNTVSLNYIDLSELIFGVIKNLPNGWALNTEYFGEIMHYLRDELAYRAVVDQLLQLPKNSATRDTEAIKRICTGYLKLLFPNATDVSKVDISLFETYCLAPAMEMRRVIKTQLGIIDEGEFGGMTIPEITIKEQYREK